MRTKWHESGTVLTLWEDERAMATLGLLYIASPSLERHLDEIRIVDAFCENLSEEALIERVMNEKPDVFGINRSTHKSLDAISPMRSDAHGRSWFARKARV